MTTGTCTLRARTMYSWHNKKLDSSIHAKIGGEINPTPGESKSFLTAVAYCTHVPGIMYIYASCAT